MNKNKQPMQILILFWVFMMLPVLVFAGDWTEEMANSEAFKNVKHKINVSQYAKDPNYEENMQATNNGQMNFVKVKDRAISVESNGYLVSHLNAQGEAKETIIYEKDGTPHMIRLFSSTAFPRTAYVYCYNACERYGKTYQPGELSGVQFQPSDSEVFFFKADGALVDHKKMNY